MFGYSAKFESTCVNGYSSKGQYGEWSNIPPMFIQREIELPDILSKFEYSENQILFLVWVEVNYGNSFGNAYNKEIECIGLFSGYTSAIQLKECIEENPEIYSITTSDGQVFEDKNPFWNSDFESLSCVNIDTVILKDKISC